jgi:pyruvate/2-oxoglutarate dehydrogenase complex dihydrolipoamide dehydrogenase (E3) component
VVDASFIHAPHGLGRATHSDFPTSAESDVMPSFDNIILGAGQAGPSLAGRLAAAGQTVALVERHLFGGTCVNTGCMPTKTLVASAYAAHVARRAADFGVVLNRDVRVDMKRVQARAAKVSADARSGVESWLRGMQGCTVINGQARFESPTTVRVGEEVLTAPRIFINVGGRAVIPNVPGVADVPYLTNTSMVALDVLPEHLIVVGGSYIGLEFAQMYRRFGSHVTVLERSPRFLAHEDDDTSEAIRDVLVGEGIDLRLGVELASVSRHEQGVAVAIGGGATVVGSHLLLAVGRRPNTDDLGLEHAGVAVDARGYIHVDDALSTNVPGIWALGDCNGRGAFTHTAYNDFEIVADNVLDGASRRLSDRIRGYALYIDPPLGRAGMTEQDARAAGRPILVGKRPMTRVGRAVERGETKGFMKVIVDAETRKILGGAILGPGGDEAIHSILNMMNAGIDFEVLQHAVPIHPTVSELIPTILGEMAPA